MSSIPRPTIEQLIGWLDSSVATVFETNYHLHAVPISEGSIPSPDGQFLSVSVGFSGDINVSVQARISLATATRLASTFLEMPASELDESTIGDAMGELGNMVVGGIKSIVLDLGIPCELSIPIVTFGSNAQQPHSPGDVTQLRVFAFDGGHCLFEVTLHTKS